MNILMIIAGILGYVFLARMFYNLAFEKAHDSRFLKPRIVVLDKYDDGEISTEHGGLASAFFPLYSLLTLVVLVFHLPIKAADFATNPSNYKFRIRVERK